MQATLQGQKGQSLATYKDFLHGVIVIPHLRNPASRNNTGKILPRLNPNFLKQVESLSLKSTERERGLGLHDSYPRVSKCGLVHTKVFPSWRGRLHPRPEKLGENESQMSFKHSSQRSGGFLRSPWRTTEWVSRGETGLHWTERRIHSCWIHSDNEGGAAAPPPSEQQLHTEEQQHHPAAAAVKNTLHSIFIS